MFAGDLFFFKKMPNFFEKKKSPQQREAEKRKKEALQEPWLDTEIEMKLKVRVTDESGGRSGGRTEGT